MVTLQSGRQLMPVHYDSNNIEILGPYSPSILKTFLVLFSRFFYIQKHLNVTQLLIG